jgi:hypothetical protein
MNVRMQGFAYALAILLNGIVAVWWTVLCFAITRQHGFAFDSGYLSLVLVPIASASALVAIASKLRN